MAKAELEAVLAKEFGFTSFKTGQREVIEAILAGENALAMLPTGGGKSLIYQMIGRVRNGLTIIVTPLLSLMQDQVARLNYAGENKVVALNSTLGTDTRRAILRSLSDYNYLFISPEMLGQTVVLSAIKKVSVNLLVVDEAHTIVTWGQDFRPDYLALPTIHQKLGQPQLLLLTATATPAMVQTIVASFEVPTESWFIYQQSVDRPNIHLHTEQLANEGLKRERLAELVRTVAGPGIIYFASRKVATAMADWLQDETGVRVAVYHAGMDNFERYRVQQQFMLGQVDVIAATSAFGMGIDKNDVRYVIHYHLSNDLANYLQEIGRAGRDGQQSLAVSLYVPGDESMQLNMIDNSIPSESVIRGVYRDQLTTAEIGQGQFDLVNFYKKRGFEEEQVVVAFADRKASRLLSLNQLVEFVSATKDLRQKLLRAFDDSTAFNDQNESSGASNLHIEELGLSFVSKEPMTAGLLEWHQVLGKMFNLG